MAIVFTCPECGRQLRAQDEAAGRKARCPQCGTIADIPTAAAPAEDDAPAEQYGLFHEGGAAAPPPAAAPAMEATRLCPYCSETIDAAATECPFCGEFLEPPPGAGPAPPRAPRKWPYSQPTDTFEIGTCISQGWAAAKDHYGIFVGAVFLAFVINTAASSVPYAGILASFFLAPHLTAGKLYIGMRGFRGRRPEIGDLFAGFSNYGVILGAYFLVFLLSAACAVPAVIAIIGAVLLGSMQGQAMVAAAWVIGGIGVAVSMVLMCYIAVRYFFVLALAVDRRELSAMDCLTECSRLTHGRRLQLFLFAFVVGVLMGGSFLLCGIGLLLLGYPLWIGATAGAYCLLMREKREIA